MNRILKCLNTPTVSSWCNYSSLLLNLAPSTKEVALNNFDGRLRNYERYPMCPKHCYRLASRVLCNSPQRRRSDVKKVHSKSSSSIIVRPICDRSILFDEIIPIQASTSGAHEMLLFSAVGKEVEKYPEGKPNWEKLQHICVRLADTWPKFFVRKMDYTIFRDDVVVEDRIYARIVRGVHEYMKYVGILAVAGRIMYPQIEMHVMNLTPILDDATVRLRWRIYYLTVFDWLLMLIQFQKFTPEYMKSRGRWYDGYSIYCVDSSGAVYKHIVDKVIPDEEKGLAKRRYSLVQRLQALLGGSVQRKPATQPTNCV